MLSPDQERNPNHLPDYKGKKPIKKEELQQREAV